MKRAHQKVSGKNKVRCELCAAQTAPQLYTKNGYPYHRCEQCGFAFLFPMPSNEALRAAYNDGYRDISATFYPKHRSRRWRAFWKSLRFLPHVSCKRVLDIGCGGGFMTHAFSGLGAHAFGLDISRPSIDYARAHNPRSTFYCEEFEVFAARELVFDFVFSTELMEHIPEARPFMSLVAAVTRPGAHVYIATPDSEHPGVPRHLPDWSDLQPPHHVQFFNRRNMEKLFEEYGFKLKWAYKNRKPALSLLFMRT